MLTADNFPLLLIFLGSAALGAYFQALTGFALGIIVLAITILTGAANVADTANALAIMTVCNVSVVLPRIWRSIDWRGLLLMSVGLWPGLLLGLALLEHLSAHGSIILRILVGLLVVFSGIVLFRRPPPLDRPSGFMGFGGSGLVAGVLGGLFAIPGPPVIYHYYRQPMTLDTIRASLLTLFVLISVVRLLLVAYQSDVTVASIKLGLLSVPVVALTSWICTRFPPRISDRAVRAWAAWMLGAMGVFIVIMAIRQL